MEFFSLNIFDSQLVEMQMQNLCMWKADCAVSDPIILF